MMNIKHLGPIAEKVEHVMRLGQKNGSITYATPITLDALARMPGWTVPLTRHRMCHAAHYLRVERGIPVCATKNGYFLARNEQEIRETIKVLAGKINGTRESMEALERIRFAMFEMTETNGTPIKEECQ